ncbi:zinc ribbon domain-containing protein [Paenibacillus sp. FSL R7-0345]|uniref:zinc ribbon domain-containing protein n=1 Tax=Paenibacillus sp. FSL R7-0345 TaxID=2954535 RepID=UPI00315AF994
MSFFDKFKAGVSEAGNKAKTVVEVNRLKLQNSGKQSEIDKQYQAMGKQLFEATLQGSPLPTDAYAVNMSRILALKAEIEANLEQISALGDVKICKDCNSTVPADARFCPNCGHTFEAPREP